MPQFEIKDSDSSKPVTVVRARSIDEAARRYFGVDESRDLSIDRAGDFDALAGWREVHVDGRVIGQIRAFQRMKFRRA